MTEQDWLTCDDPFRMVSWLRGNPLDAGANIPPTVLARKFRLFACACCHAVSDELGRDAEYCAELPRGPAKDAANWAMGWAGDQKVPTAAERAALLRCLVGNPFRPMRPVAPCADGPTCPQHGYPWLTPQVLAVARSIYDDRRFEDLPVLADPLEEAGCTDAELLGHLRGTERCLFCHGVGVRRSGMVKCDVYGIHDSRREQKCLACAGTGRVWGMDSPGQTEGRQPLPHARGCWCLDLLLGKE